MSTAPIPPTCLRFYEILWIAVGVFLTTLILMSCTGCQAPGPERLRLPTTAALTAPIMAAQAHVIKAQAIDKREAALAKIAASKGIAPGSEEFRELSTLIGAHSKEDAGAYDALTESLYQRGLLQKELDAKTAEWNAKYAALYRHDQAQTKKVTVLERAKHHWQLAVLILIVADFFLGAPIQAGLHWLVSAIITEFLTFWKLALTWIARLAPLCVL